MNVSPVTLEARAAPASRPHVIFTVTSGWGIRNFVQSGVFERLAAEADISVAVTAALRPYFMSMPETSRVCRLLEAPEGESPVRRLVRQARKAVFQGVHRVETARIKRASSDNPLVRFLQRLSWSVQCSFAANWQLRLLDALERRLPDSHLTDFPAGASLLVNTSPFDPRDNRLQRAAARSGLATLAIIPSWDNPSSKGCILSDTDRVLVWSPVQKAEMLDYYPELRETQLAVSGIPQFDGYLQGPDGADDTFRSHLGIPAGSRVILFSTSSPKLFPHEPIVLGHLVDALEAGRFGPDAHILVRCHPVDSADRYAKHADRPCVTIFPSSLESGAALATWKPPEAELDILAATLRNSAVCVNTASTMTLDAASSGRPVVNIGYDAGKTEPFHRSVRRFYSYSHYAKVAAAGYAPVASSSEELIQEIALALEGDRNEETGRAKFIAAFCPTPQGGSVAFIADYIATLARMTSNAPAEVSLDRFARSASPAEPTRMRTK